MQVSKEISKLDPRLQVVTVYGGASISNQLNRLRNPVDVVVGTPGRVLHFLDSGDLQLDNVKALVLDEADQMLDIGYVFFFFAIIFLL